MIPLTEKKPQMWPICKAHDATEWLTPFRASCNAADGPQLRFFLLDAVADDDLHFGEHALVEDGIFCRLDDTFDMAGICRIIIVHRLHLVGKREHKAVR